MNAIITGGTKGIGLAIVKIFAEKGINMAVCSRNEKDLDNLKKELLETHPDIKVATMVTDLRDPGQIKGFGKFAISHFEKIDVLVNNAGLYVPGTVHNEKDGVLELMIETNLYSAYHMSRAIIPNMISNQSGHIINICSVASILAYPDGGSYSISKFAMLGLSKVLREELKEKNISVTSVLPGITWSNAWKGAKLPKSRLMQAEDVAKAVYGAIEMSPSAVVEEIILRPQLGDL